MSTISSGKTIAKNTLFLYFRMLFTMCIGLFTARVNLSVLGIVDNGIYQVVGGVVAMFAFLNGSLSGATSRFLTFELGKGNTEKLKDTFAAVFNVHLIVALIILVLGETVGLWFLNNKLVIPEDRYWAAHVVYQFSIISSMISITQVPYNASIISHEKMSVFAYISILEASLKLIVCYMLYITPFDKLITYALLILIVTFSLQMLYRVYCIKHFEECHFKRKFDKEILNPILSFSGWDLFGNFSVMARNHGVNMIMNMFLGPVINSAVGFSNTIGTSVLGFSNNFLSAIRPPIVKAYSLGEYGKMESLMIDASKFSFSLLLLLSAPFIFESSTIIELWLKTPPPYTDVFCKLELTLSVLSSMFLPLVFALHASGKIRFMSIVNGSIWLLVIPITWILLRNGFSPVVPYVTKIGLLFFVVTSNLYSTKHYIPEFKVRVYLKKAVLPSALTLLLSMSIIYLIFINLGGPSINRFILLCVSSTIIVCVSTYFIVFDKDKRIQILKALHVK